MPMTLTAVNAISAMVAPVVLLTVGCLLSNGLLTVYSSVNDRLREMTRERFEILTGPSGERLEVATVPPMSQERLREIKFQLPLLLRRHKLTRLAVFIIYVAIAILGLSIVVIAIAVTMDDEVAGRVALGLVLAGTIAMVLGIGVASISLARSADAITYAVQRAQSEGLLADKVPVWPIGSAGSSSRSRAALTTGVRSGAAAGPARTSRPGPSRPASPWFRRSATFRPSRDTTSTWTCGPRASSCDYPPRSPAGSATPTSR
jgi:hypothetical protein